MSHQKKQSKTQAPKLPQSNLSRRVFLKGSAASIAAALSAMNGSKLTTQGIFAPNVVRAQTELVLAVQEFTHDILNSVLPEFEDATGFSVSLEGGPVSGNDMLTRYSAAFAAGNSPVDVFSDSDDSSPTFMRAGWLEPLNDVIPEETWNDFPESMQGHIDGFLSIDGERYRVPHEFAVGYFFTRQDLLEENNLSVPTTWEEMVEVGRQFADPDNNIWATTDGLIQPALLYVYMAYLTAQSGGDIFAFDEATAEAFQFLYDMMNEHRIFPRTALNQDYTAQNELYMDDRVLFMRQWPFFQGVAEGNEDWYAPEKVAITLPPAGPAGSKSWIGGWGWSVPTAAPNKEGAFELIRFLTRPDIAARLAEQQGFFLTPRNSILEILDAEDPLVQAISLYSENNVFSARPFHPRVAEAQSVVDDMASLFLTDQASLRDVMLQGRQLIEDLDNV